MQHHIHATTRVTTPTREIQRIAVLGVAALATLGLTFGAASPALAHDELINTSLEFDDTTSELRAIALMFSNDIMDVGTEIIVTDEANSNVSSAAPEVSGPTVKQSLDAPLAAGAYQAVWRVVSSDGHPIQGVAAFKVAANGSAELTEVAAEDDHADSDDHSADESEVGHDHGEAEVEAVPISGEVQDKSSSFPVIGWVAIAVVLIGGISGGAIYASKKRKRATETADATTPTNGSDTVA